MADFDSKNNIPQDTVTSAQKSAVDVGLRNYMIRVYNYMAAGLLLTGITAYVSAYSGLYAALQDSFLIWLVMLAPLGMVLFLSVRIQKISAAAAQTSFWIFAGVMGLSLSYIFLAYTGSSIVRVFIITAATFGSLSLYGYTTKRNLGPLGAFLFMGLIGLIIAMIVNSFFVQSGQFDFVISILGVLIFAGLTAYDTQKIKSIYMVSDSSEASEKKAVMGALALYLDFINIFILLLRFMGDRR